jgi:hypothetical protein
VLGLEGDLAEEDEPVEGIGSKLDLYTTMVPIRGRVVITELMGGNVSVRHYWGRMFTLNPWFGEDDKFILGREDFFAAFDNITFEEPRRIFHLEYF